MKRITIYTIVLSLISFSMISAAQNKGFRAIRVINDLSRKSGKIGTCRALIIGISDYKDSRIPDLETPLNDAQTMAGLLGGKMGSCLCLTLMLQVLLTY